MSSSTGKLLIHIIVLLQWTVLAAGAQATSEISNAVNHDYPKKHWKRLRKQDGALRLVGGRNEHEGEQAIPFSVPHGRTVQCVPNISRYSYDEQ